MIFFLMQTFIYSCLALMRLDHFIISRSLCSANFPVLEALLAVAVVPAAFFILIHLILKLVLASYFYFHCRGLKNNPLWFWEKYNVPINPRSGIALLKNKFAKSCPMPILAFGLKISRCDLGP